MDDSAETRDRNAALTPSTIETAPPARHPVKAALTSIGGGAARLIGKGRAEVAEGLQAAGASVERLHRRMALFVLALVGVMVLGAGFRALGWPAGDYVLIALVGALALYVVVSPVHLVGLMAAGGGLAAWKGKAEAKAGLLAYARVLGVILLGVLTPLVLFAVAPGDSSFWLSMRLLLLTPIVILALWLFGEVAPRAQKAVFIAAPLAAFVLAMSNMLIPETTLAALGVPAWLRAPRPQDEELARLERVLEQRRNEDRAVRLKDIRLKVEAGRPLTAEDEAVIAAAQRDRVTLTDWVGDRSQAVLAEVRRRSADSAAKGAATAAAAASAGSIVVRAGEWSQPLPVPKGRQLCTTSDRGERAYTTQCALGDGDWTRRSAGGCEAGGFDRARFVGRSEDQTLRYRLPPAGSDCSA